MTDKMNAKITYAKSVPLSKWLIDAKSQIAEKYAAEDSDKRARLVLLSTTADVPIAWSREFSVSSVLEIRSAIDSIGDLVGSRLLGVRLIGARSDGAVMRTRGLSAEEVKAWAGENFEAGSVDARIELSSHVDRARWSTIFVVTESGVAGDVVAGDPQELTQGEAGQANIVQFHFDFKNFSWSATPPPEMADHVLDVLGKIQITNQEIRSELTNALGARFCGDYLQGYFETVDSPEWGATFLDYNRLLVTAPPSPASRNDEGSKGKLIARGSPASAGTVTGTARVISNDELSKGSYTFERGDILVCKMTTGAHLPLMAIAGGVITDFGGVLSHAAIVCRELSIPCVSGTRNATEAIATGQRILLDAKVGVVFEA